ncbi:hypothetical protein [Romboutsia weinsteinii]|nr:hypothetical protein [Romboutsia weinsteinii]
MEKIGLILEGGGMRGIYTAGVLDFFIEKNIDTLTSIVSIFYILLSTIT